MKKKMIGIAAVTLLTLTGATRADSGMDFYRMCGTGLTAGFLNRDYCHGYLWGIAVGLHESRQICMQPGTTDTQVVMVVQDWLRAHPQNLNRPANYMIRNALVAAWPCN